MNRYMRLLLLLLLALAAACTPARREIEGNIARRIRFVGNGGPLSGQNDLQLRGAMEQDNTALWVAIWPFLYWVDPEVLRPDLLQRDAYRLEVWYAQNGYFNAMVHGWELRQVRPQTERKAGIFDIWGYVTPGPESLVRTYEITGLPPSLAVLERAMRLEAPLEQGEQFYLDDVYATRAEMLRILQNHSYAYATVQPQVEAHPDALAVDVAFAVEPGISTLFGPITITGNDKIDEEDIRAVIPIEEGDEYKLNDLAYTRQRLFQMSTFSLVTVEPDLSDPTVDEVPVVISVSETKFRRLRLGGGAEIESGNIQPRVTGQFQHVNLFDELIRMELQASAGLAVILASDGGAPELQPTYLLGSSFTYPRIIGEKLDLELSARIEQDVQAGLWAYRQPEADLRLVWRPTRQLAFRAGPHVEQYEFLHLTNRAEQAARQIFGTGTEFVNPYQLTALDQNVTADFRDDPIATTRGWYAALNLRESIPITERGFSFASARGEFRLFRPIRFTARATSYPLIFAGRASAGYIHAFDDRGVPYPELNFLGGPNSIRGFRPRQVGPYDTLCTYDGDEVRHFHLPLGGTLSGESTLELRYPWKYGVTFATFVDAGVLERDVSEIGFDDARWSAGVGARYETLIGPIRLDVSFRPLYPEDEGPREFVNCRPEDLEPRAFDLFSSFASDRANPANRPPVAVVFYLAIGEAL